MFKRGIKKSNSGLASQALVMILAVVFVLGIGAIYVFQSNSCSAALDQIDTIAEKENYCVVDSDCVTAENLTSAIGCYALVNSSANLSELNKMSERAKKCEPPVECPQPPHQSAIACRNNKCVDLRQIACPQDAKLCPDGSAVYRLPPSCHFEGCSKAQLDVSTWKTYRNEKYSYEVKYPENMELSSISFENTSKTNANEIQFALAGTPFDDMSIEVLEIREFNNVHKKFLKDVSPSTPNKISIDGFLAEEYVYQHQQENIAEKRILLKKTDRVFWFGGLGNPHRLGEEFKVFDQMLSTFKFLK